MAGDLFIVLTGLITSCKELLARHHLTTQETASLPDVLVPTAFNFPHTGKLMSLSFVLFAVLSLSLAAERLRPCVAGEQLD
jgi:hypothetical protein